MTPPATPMTYTAKDWIRFLVISGLLVSGIVIGAIDYQVAKQAKEAARLAKASADDATALIAAVRPAILSADQNTKDLERLANEQVASAANRQSTIDELKNLVASSNAIAQRVNDCTTPGGECYRSLREESATFFRNQLDQQSNEVVDRTSNEVVLRVVQAAEPGAGGQAVPPIIRVLPPGNKTPPAAGEMDCVLELDNIGVLLCTAG